VREAIGRMKYVEESNFEQRYHEIKKQLHDEIHALSEGGRENA